MLKCATIYVLHEKEKKNMVSVFNPNSLQFSCRANQSPEQTGVEESENESEYLNLETKFLSEDICEVNDQVPPPIDHVIEVCTVTTPAPASQQPPKVGTHALVAILIRLIFSTVNQNMNLLISYGFN